MASQRPDLAALAATKSRTIAHMNKDHREDMALYLRHYLGLGDSSLSSAPELVDIEPAALLIRTTDGSKDGRTHRVPVDPPMLPSLADARERLADLTKAAAAAPARDTGTEKLRYRRPRGFDIVVFSGVVFYFACAAAVFSGAVTPADGPEQQQPTRLGAGVALVLRAVRWPGGPWFFCWLVRTIFLPVLGIHVAEDWWLNRTRLAPAGLGPGSAVWWAWMGSCFFEGLPAFRRFDAMVAGKTGKKE